MKSYLPLCALMLALGCPVPSVRRGAPLRRPRVQSGSRPGGQAARPFGQLSNVVELDAMAG